MDLDDMPIGRVLTRREALAFLGASGALLFFGCSIPPPQPCRAMETRPAWCGPS